MDTYNISLVLIGLTAIGSAVLPPLLKGKPVSVPIIYLGLGLIVFSLPLGLPAPDPLRHSAVTERLTELAVIVSLMAAGLKLDRPPGWRRWGSTWRLLAITMVLTIAGTTLLGWWMVGLPIAAAMLLGAAIAPTDPVLASDVQVGEPLEEEYDGEESEPDEEKSEVRFSLTSEAGLNDGLAFPFTNLAIAVAAAGIAPSDLLRDWLLVDVLYKLTAGVLIGYFSGRLLGWAIFKSRVGQMLLVRKMEGSIALAATLLIYGATELLHAYGFLAVFAAAVSLRSSEREHDYHKAMHDFAVTSEQLLMAVLMLLFGGSLANGLLASLTWEAAVVGLAVLLLIRPLAGYVGLIGMQGSWQEKAAISFFGIRGLGSLYYLSHALNEASFEQASQLWALVGFIVAVSVVLHGMTASPAMHWIESGTQSKSR